MKGMFPLLGNNSIELIGYQKLGIQVLYNRDPWSEGKTANQF